MSEDWKERELRFAKALAEFRGCELVYLVCCGSHAYGTDTPASDRDIRGVFVPPLSHFVGLERSRCRTMVSRRSDIVLHPVDKFFDLAAKNNPNILDWLYVPGDLVLFRSPAWARVVSDNHYMFLSRRLAARFGGYARGHFHKMDMGTKSTRDLGAQRKADLAEHGYSTKNAMHLIRLARMACEVLETGFYRVMRPDAAGLLDIRAGRWAKDTVVDEGNKLLARLDSLVKDSPLPERPDLDGIEAMLMALVMPEAPPGTKSARKWDRLEAAERAEEASEGVETWG